MLFVPKHFFEVFVVIVSIEQNEINHMTWSWKTRQK